MGAVASRQDRPMIAGLVYGIGLTAAILALAWCFIDTYRTWGDR